MANYVPNFLGQLVEAGYLTSWHEGLAYVHWSNGERWASIDPWTNVITDLRTDTPYCPRHHDHMMRMLQELADYGEVRTVTA